MTLKEQLDAALHDLRLRNARRINLLRVIATLAFTISIMASPFGSSSDDWQVILRPTTIYLGGALVLLVVCNRNAMMLWAGRFAVLVFDMPLLFTIQWMHLETNSSPVQKVQVSEFSVSLFACLLLLSAFTLNKGHLLLSLLFAIVLEQLLQIQAGVSVGARCSSVMVLCFVTWICFYAGRNRLRLAESLVEANARRRRLQRYFWPGVGKILEEREADDLAQGRERELTVLFADIRGFTALSEHLPCREVIQLLNCFHARMVEAVFHHEGTLDKYLGDGLMIYFNAPVEQLDHARRAMCCAMEMLSALTTLRVDGAGEGGTPLRMGIGIHTGRAIVGDVGAPHRREFTAIGPVVNVAARLEQMTKDLGVGVLLSEATAMLVGDTVELNEMGSYPVRGCSEPIRLLTLRTA